MKKRATTRFKKNWKTFVILILILALAAGLRFTGVNWDEGSHIHPDERFLTMIATDIKWPSAGSYFDSENSSLNPYNTGNKFFVYGTFPLFLTKTIGDVSGMNGYDHYPSTGRMLSAIFDILTIVILFLIARRIFNDTIALLSAFLLAITVLHIQHSHFFVVDLYATFFVVLAFYFLLLWHDTEKPYYAVLTGLSWGFAIASKISALFFGAIIFVGCLLLLWKKIQASALKKKRRRIKDILKSVMIIFFCGIIIIFSAFIIFRIFQPYAFTGPHIWNIGISKDFATSMKDLSNLHSRESGYIPVLQWRNKTAFFQIKSLTFWGLGIPLSIICWIGLIFGVYYALKKRNKMFLLAIFLAVFLLTFHALQFVKYSRYVLPAVPFLILCGAFLLGTIIKKAQSMPKKSKLRFAAYSLVVLLLSGCILWTIAFTHIYFHRHPIVVASAWIYDTIPVNTTIANEHWDNNVPFYPPADRFHLETLELFEQDNDAKIQKLSEQLSRIDYIFINSNRLYMVIPKLPTYPYTARYYDLLFNGTLGFGLEKTFTNYPRLFGIEINDDYAEEAFTSYDHPKVLVFKKESQLSKDELFKLIKGD
jgi:hypothetical protein